ncbi:MAG: FAD-dependent oxidoreductase [Mariniblastus sp.]|nr:FAD-dependent oxidoreductase [Mariniblastus sp.]
MRVAIIGGGVSGLVTGYRLHKQHDVTLFEANDYVGGHTNTIDIENDEGQFAIDTGFIVFNDRTYPNFIALMDELKVASQPTRMSFSVSCEKTGLEYRGADFNGLFAQRRNLFNPKFLKLLWDLVRFNKAGEQLLENEQENETVGEFFERNNFSPQFIEQYFMPMGAAIWSASFETFRQFPIRFIAEFYHNHGLLGVTNRPQWRVITGGSRQYIAPLTQDWSNRIHTNQPVRDIHRTEDEVVVITKDGQSHSFDHIVFACHSDQALRILGNQATAVESEILSSFPYHPNTALLHTQESVLPKNRRAWACWNYFKPERASSLANVTYNMNILQSLNSKQTFCVTLNDDGRIRDENILGSYTYMHPTFEIRRKQMQARHHELINRNSTSFCGAYWGNGFHEDGVKSAIAVANQLEKIDVGVGC